MKIGKLRQLILMVEDMQKQVMFYRDTMGLQVVYPHVDDYSKESWVSFASGDCALCLHSGGKANPDVDQVRFTFEVLDIESAKQELEEKGVIMGKIRTAAPGKLVSDFRDPEGNLLHIEFFNE
ncbi:MAG: VOC family protein [Candidatus Kariarchaeaceae archaeon]|jgi:catechol 2,3-dioxygenase-like lactoylglutathione lyase family enzyme